MKQLPLQIFLVILPLLFSQCLLAADKKILVFGDSLSAGYGIDIADSWPMLLQQQLQKNYPDYRVINASISGETAAGGARRIDDVLQRFQPDILVLELGANDGLRGAAPGSIADNLRRIIQHTHQHGASVILLGMKIPPNYGQAYANLFEQNYQQLAQEFNLALVPFFLKGVKPEQFQSDNLHPDASAQPLLMQHVWKQLQPMLQTQHK